MFVDVAQSPAELRRIFAAMGLAAPGETPRATPLAGGVSSAISRVDLASGAFCLKQALPQLKVAKLWKVPVERVFAEIEWLRTASGIVPGHVPQVIGTDDATRSFVMPFLGSDHRNWKAELMAGRVDVEVAHGVGNLIGRIHAATAGAEAAARQFANDANFHALRLEPYLVETARVHADLAPRLQALVDRTQRMHVALVHGDLSPKNILVGPKGPVLLDAECAWYGDPAFDLAFCLNHLLLKAAWRPALGPALMRSSVALTEAYWPQVRFEPRAALEERVAALLPALALARVDGKSPAEYLDEPLRKRVRLAAITLLQRGNVDLATIRSFWSEEFPS